MNEHKDDYDPFDQTHDFTLSDDGFFDFSPRASLITFPHRSLLFDFTPENFAAFDLFASFNKPAFALAGNGDSVGDSPSDAATITIGNPVVGTVDEAGDSDWFSIQLTAGQRYEFTLSGHNPNALLDPYLELMDSTGAQIAFNDDAGGLNSRLYFTADTSGTYYLNAHAFINANNPSYSETGQYLLTANEAGPVENWTYEQIANFLTNEYWDQRSWASPSLTFDTTALSPERASFAAQALQAWADLSALTFTEVTTDADITFTAEFDSSDPNDSEAPDASARSSVSGGTITSSTVNISTNWRNTSQSGDGIDGYVYQTYLHEIGHALGLGHAGYYNGDATYGTDNLYTNDSWSSSIMSYFDQAESGSGSYRFVLGPQIADIIAIQNLYGVNPDGTRPGDTTYGFNSTENDINDWSQFVLVEQGGTDMRPPSMSIFDTGGIDTIDLSGYAVSQYLNLNSGEFSSLGQRSSASQPVYENVISIANNTVIENAIGGSADDTIVLNEADNTIDGGAGTDTVISNTTSSVALVSFQGITYLGGSSVNRLTNIEQISFSDNTTISVSSIHSFDAQQYILNYADLRSSLGNDLIAATLHYIQQGFDEGRTDAAFEQQASVENPITFVNEPGAGDVSTLDDWLLS